MLIKISERLLPFSHLPGTLVLLPGSSLRLQVYPELVKIENISGPTPILLATLLFQVRGPVEEFTVQQDLEKGCVRVWGHATHGFFRYTFHALQQGSAALCHVEKGMKEEIVVTGAWTKHTIPEHTNQFIISHKNTDVAEMQPYTVPLIERLSLGNSKAQDWALISRRRKMEEIIPLWHCLGQLVITKKPSDFSNSSSLVEKCRQTIATSRCEAILPCFLDIFLTGFEGLLSPRFTDTDHQGICSGLIHSPESPLYLLKDGKSLIRSLFIQENGEKIHVLPALLPEFHCGRLLDAKCVQSGILSIEWSKKSLRRMTFSAKEEQSVVFTFSHDLTACRLRTDDNERGVQYVAGTPIKIVPDQNYRFDNFRK